MKASDTNYVDAHEKMILTHEELSGGLVRLINEKLDIPGVEIVDRSSVVAVS